jgi:sulfite exporter TauE/SafE
MFKIALGMFVTGLFFGSGPCLVNCGPVLISYILGTKNNIHEGFFSYFLFSLSRIAVYLFLSLIIFFLGQAAAERLLADFSGYVFILGGSFISLIGLFLALGKKIFFRPLRVIEKYLLRKENKNSIILGFIFGLLPCAPILVLLGYIGLFSRNWAQSLFYASAFGIGTFLSPLLFLAFFAGILPGFLKNKSEIYSRILSRASGLIMFFLGMRLIMRGL